jgi:hypothetical protein
LYVATGGYYSVTSISDDNDVVLNNLGYTANASPGSTIASGATVSPGGIEGPAGAAGSAGNSSVINYEETIADPGPDSADPATVTLATVGPFTFTGECFADQEHLIATPVIAETFVSTSQDFSAVQDGETQTDDSALMSGTEVQIGATVSGTVGPFSLVGSGAGFIGPDEGSTAFESADNTTVGNAFTGAGVFVGSGSGAAVPACTFFGYIDTY